MINTNSLGILGQFYFNVRESFKSIYQNSNFYEKKISKTFLFCELICFIYILLVEFSNS